jgi:Mrp family chromosome partitioning ATPase
VARDSKILLRQPSTDSLDRFGYENLTARLPAIAPADAERNAMGRLLEALRQADSPRLPHPMREDQPPILCPAVEDVPEVVQEEAGQEVPFVEVGPHHSVEGSPEVMATVPPLPQLHAVTTPEPTPDQPHVTFRPLPAKRISHDQPGFARELVAFHAPDMPAAVRYRELLGSLLVAVECSRPQERCPVLLFTAVREGIGSTTVVLNVAITAARPGRRRVVVVDANLRRPAVAQRLNLPIAPGLREVIAGAVTLDRALRETNQKGLLALTAGLAASGPGPRFVAETMRSLLRQLRQRADLVLIDGPCWDGRPEVVSLAAAVDAVYPVFPEEEAETSQTDALLEAIAEHAGRLAGCILAGRQSE